MNRPKPTSLEFALLGLLSQASQSGYDLRKVFAETALGSYSSSPGAIYPALKRLEAKGLVTGAVENSETLRPKKIFSPTPAGREALRAWLLQEVTREDVEKREDELMLRFAFFATLDDPKASRNFLREIQDRTAEVLADLEGQLALFENLDGEAAALARYGRLAFEYGLEHLRLLERWAGSALKQFVE